jgi:hypothetical protein
MYANPTNVQANAAQADILARWFLLRDERRWTKRFMALSETGASVESDDPDACRWCLIGAGERVGHNEKGDYALRREVGCGVVYFNDDFETTHSHILAALVKAFEIAGERA